MPSVSDILRKVRQIELRTRRLVDDTLVGSYHSVFKGRGMDFAKVREYVPGDEVRGIDWNVTARMGRPFVKEFTEERELTVLLMIDVSASGEFGSGDTSKRAWMAELGSVLAFSALRNRDKVGLILFTDEVELYLPPAKGRGHVLRLIREILAFEPRGRRTDVAGAIHFANQVLHRRAITFLISDFHLLGDFDARIEALRPKLASMNRRHDVVPMVVRDPREAALPDVGLLTLEDAETGEQIELDTRRSSVRAAYAREAVRRRARLGRAIRSGGMDLLELDTDRPYLPVLKTFFANRKRRLA